MVKGAKDRGTPHGARSPLPIDSGWLRAGRSRDGQPGRAPPAGEPAQAADRAAWQAWADARAQAAFRRARMLEDAGDSAGALPWYERAHRLAPDSPNVMFPLAMARLRGGDAVGSVRLLRVLTRRFVFPEGWAALSGALLAAGEEAAAVAAAQQTLSRYAPPEDMDALFGRLASQAGRPGWCGLSASGRLRLGGMAPGAAPPDILFDGHPARLRTGKDGPVLPPCWRLAGTVEILAGGVPLLGSPLDPAALMRTEGFVESGPGGLSGWIWHPADPEHVPDLRVLDARTSRVLLHRTVPDRAMDVSSAIPLARPRRFVIPAAGLPPGPVRVVGADGRDLMGSPLRSATGPGGKGEGRPPGPPSSRPSPRAPGCPSYGSPDGSPGCSPGCSSGAHSLRSPCRPPGVTPRRARPAIVVPVHGDRVATLACLESVRDSVGPDVPVVVVDDATPDATLAADLDRLAAAGTIRLVRHARTLGFPASANDGMCAVAGHDVVLLNSDTLVAGGWLAELADIAYGAAGIGTVTPLSNQASIFSWPGPDRVPDAMFGGGGEGVPDGMSCPALDLTQVRRIMAAARAANRGVAVDVPTGHGFCLFIRHDCLAAFWQLHSGSRSCGPPSRAAPLPGLLRADLFAQGYGEENEFCLRAAALGWRHVAAPGAFVGHVGAASFGPASFGGAQPALLRRNLAIVNRLHPGYDAMVASHIAADPLFAARRRLDLVCWRRDGAGWDRAVLLVTHDQGGGVERVVRARAAAWRGQGARPVVLRPAPGGCRLEEMRDEAHGTPPAWSPSPRFRLPGEWDMLVAVLRASGIGAVEWHHRLGHGVNVRALAASLGVPYDVHVHDYVWFCPRVALVGASGRYCGEPGPAGCAACLASGGSVLEDGGPIPDRLSRFVARSRADLRRARAVIAPSDDSARRLGRHFPGLAIRVTALEDDRPDLDLASFARLHGTQIPDSAFHDAGFHDVRRDGGPRRGRVRVAVPGAIGVEKGYDILLAAARDAAARDLNLEFVVVGHTSDDDSLIATGRAFVTGPYREAEAVILLAAQQADLALLPSVWPETWCFALGLAWRAGLRAVAFDLGAIAERIRRTGRGAILPLGLPIHELNTFLLSHA
jgi:glycosyltransferase involved in cell wall biosynthesis